MGILDGFAVAELGEWGGKRLVSVTKEGLRFEDNKAEKRKRRRGGLPLNQSARRAGMNRQHGENRESPGRVESPTSSLQTVPSRRPRLLPTVLSASATIILTQRRPRPWPSTAHIGLGIPPRPRLLLVRRRDSKEANSRTSLPRLLSPITFSLSFSLLFPPEFLPF